MAIRFTWLAALVLGLMVWNISGAEARSRTQQTQAQSRTTGTQAARATTTRRATATQARRSSSQANRASAARRSTARATNGRTARSGASREQATASCRGRNCASTRRQVSWQSGLPPATNEQAQSCPAGTLATLARGHSDVVRCLPL